VVVANDRRRPLELRAGERTSASVLKRRLIDQKIPTSEEWRYDPGPGLTLEAISASIQSTEIGLMGDFCDLAGKTIDFDPHLASLLHRRFGQVEACDWSVTPAAGEGIDRERAKMIADAVAKELRCLPSPTEWTSGETTRHAGLGPTVEALLWAEWDGRASIEKVWAPTAKAGKPWWSISELGWIHPRRLSFGPRRELRLIEPHVHAANFVEVGIDLTATPNKFLNYCPQLFREYPEREGLAVRAVYWAFMKRFGARERMILTELYGRPFKIIEQDPESALIDAEIEKLEDDLEQLGAAEQIVLPKGAKLTIPWPHPDSGTIHAAVIEQSDAQLSKLILGQTMTSDDGSSRAQGEVHERQQDLILARSGRRLVGILQPGLVDPIVRMNAGHFALENDDAIDGYMPTLEIHTEAEPDRTAEVDRIGRVIALGAPVALSTLYEVSGVRAPEEGERVIGTVAPQGRVFESAEEAIAEAAKAAQAAQQAGPGGMPGEGAPPGEQPAGEGPPAEGEQTKEDEEPAEDGQPEEGAEGDEKEDDEDEEDEKKPKGGEPPWGMTSQRVKWMLSTSASVRDWPAVARVSKVPGLRAAMADFTSHDPLRAGDAESLTLAALARSVDELAGLRVAHELGHALEVVKLPKRAADARARVFALRGKGLPVTTYADLDPSEWFAESFAAHASGLLASFDPALNRAFADLVMELPGPAEVTLAAAGLDRTLMALVGDARA
jgi:phage gp29-like protein